MTVLLRDAVDRRSLVRDGAGLKYPAVNVQEESAYWGSARVLRIWVMAGNSVDVSGESSCESWARTYTEVSLESDAFSWDKFGACLVDSFSLSSLVDSVTNLSGFSSGEGPTLVFGHDILNPEGSSEGVIRKLNEDTASWSPAK